MPSQSSLAAGVLQTVMRLSVSLGLSITAAVYSSSLATRQAKKDITFAFDRAYLCSILFAVIGVLFVPFMRIEKQGGRAKAENEKGVPHDGITGEERPRSAGEHMDSENQILVDSQGLSSAGSYRSFATQATWATYDSDRSFFPRWSWEGEREFRGQRSHNFGEGAHVVYEVCIKCMEERRVLLANYESQGSARAGYGCEPASGRGGDRRETAQARTYDIQLSSPKGYERGDVKNGGVGWI